MREIRLKLWCKERKSWVGIDKIYFGERAELCCVETDDKEFYFPDEKNFELVNYTGLKDKNGVEIYEGDIIKCTSKIYDNFGANETGEYEETIKQVIWKEDSWGTRVINSNLTSKGAEKRGLVISAKYAEVIGNIYQNKDLI